MNARVLKQLFFKPHWTKFWLIIVFGLLITCPAATRAQQTARPFSLPFNTLPGPNSWLINQQYGNTAGAANFCKNWYAAGPRLHFGIAFQAPCDTPDFAITDCIRMAVDNVST